MVRQLNAATKTLRDSMPIWGSFAQLLSGLSSKDEQGLPLLQWRPTGGNLGLTSQLNFTTWVTIPAGKALVVTLRAPQAAYYGLHLFNAWGSSLPWAHRQTSLTWGHDGRCQAQPSRDGDYRIVISAVDPGVQNWIDTMGRTDVGLVGRLQGVPESDKTQIVGADSEYKPQLQLVDVSAVSKLVRQALPRRSRNFSQRQRAQQLLERQTFQREKYYYW